MRKIVVAAMSTISGLILLFSYHTSTNSTAATTTGTDAGSEPTAGGGTTPNAGTATTPSVPSASASPSSGTSSGTFTGDAVDTRWGTVQVRITVKDGTITAADAIEYPTANPKDQQINAYAIPQLNAEAVDAQSTNIDAVSGATVTSDGYIESLQSAIDQAHLK
ncbi:MAG TPA: FMN-binding protein [Micropruina sp.]|jgi:uncharacterized protein with FMN-binding domain|nr:FMN-binding protein [Micropruina sp.]